MKRIQARFYLSFQRQKTLENYYKKVINSMIWNNGQAYRMEKELNAEKIANQNQRQSESLIFTSMIERVSGQTYSYEEPDLDGVGERLQKREQKQELQPQIKADRQQVQQDKKQQPQEQKFQQQKSRKSQKRSQSVCNRSLSFLPEQSLPHTKYAPFISINENPKDKYTNSKILKSKYSYVKYNQSMINATSIIQSYKTQNKFKSIPITTNFTNKSLRRNDTLVQQPLNVTNVLKYTLGDKREREQGKKPPEIPNPFVRVPAKFSQSLNDFYIT